jgi:hypothetical protein
VADNQIEIEIIARLEKLEDSLKRTETAAKKTGDNVADAIGGKIKGAAIAAGGAIATYLVGRGLLNAVKSAMDADDALNRMNQSLALAGRFSVQASKDFQNFASEIQRTSVIGDDVAFGYLALAGNFAKTNEEAKKLTQAAIDLSAATGGKVSVQSAIDNLGGSLSGVTGQLARLLPQVRGLTEEQLKAGAAIDFVAKRFGGAAESEVRTFSGALKQLENLWGDIREEQGFIITQSPSLVAAIKFVSDWIGKMVEQMKAAREAGGDALRPFLMTAIQVSEAFITVFGPALDFIFQKIEQLKRGIGAAASAMVNFASGEFRSAMNDVSSAILASTEIMNPMLMGQRGTESMKAFLTAMKTAVDNAPPIAPDPNNNIEQEVAKKTLTIGSMFNGMWEQIKSGAAQKQLF